MSAILSLSMEEIGGVNIVPPYYFRPTQCPSIGRIGLIVNKSVPVMWRMHILRPDAHIHRSWFSFNLGRCTRFSRGTLFALHWDIHVLPYTICVIFTKSKSFSHVSAGLVTAVCTTPNYLASGSSSGSATLELSAWKTFKNQTKCRAYPV